jgi:hypothetical protein
MPEVKKTFIIKIKPSEYISSCSLEELKELQRMVGKALKPTANKLKRMNS